MSTLRCMFFKGHGFGWAVLLLCLGATFGIAHVPAHAEGILAPPFRGLPGSTYQCWDFNGPAFNLPDCEGWMWNPNGMPTAQGNGVVWLPDLDGRDGIICMPFGSSISFTVPNSNNVMLKTILVQIIYKPHNLGTPPPNIDVAPPGAIALVNDGPAPGDVNGWRVRIWHVEIPFCPLEEVITISNASIFQVDIDRVYIDSVCGDAFPMPDPINDKQADEDTQGGCPPVFFEEREDCGDDLNGGCDSPLIVFKTVFCGDYICGKLFADAGAVDTDWYALDVPDLSGSGEATLSFSISTELPVNVRVVSGPCGFQVLWEETLAAMTQPSFVSLCVSAPATYYIVVSPGDASGPVADGFPCDNWYYLALGNCDPCPPCPALDQPWIHPPANGYFSDQMCSACPPPMVAQTLTERFSVSAPVTIGSLTMWGGMTGGGSPLDLRLVVDIVQLDPAGLPGPIIHGECHARVVQVTDTGTVVAGHAVWRLDLQLEHDVTLVPGNYGVRIVNHASSVVGTFFIVAGMPDPVHGLGGIAFEQVDSAGNVTQGIAPGLSMAILLHCGGAFQWCDEDIDPAAGNGCIDLGDLLFLLSEWSQTCSRADLDDDANVALSDLLILLSAWGPCPGGVCPAP